MARMSKQTETTNGRVMMFIASVEDNYIFEEGGKFICIDYSRLLWTMVPGDTNPASYFR